MAKVAIKKVGRPAKKKKPVGRPPKKKVGRPAKKKSKSIPESKGFVYDHLRQEWIGPADKPVVSLNHINGLIARLSIRVAIIEKKIQEAEEAGKKIHADLEKVRGKSTYKGWTPHDPDGSNGSVPADARGKMVEIMRRDGVKCSEKPSSLWSWYECGSASIVAYRVVE